MTQKKLGDLNGWWAFLFKFGLALIPFAVSWSIWVTANVFSSKAFISSGERFTQTDGRNLERRTDERLSAIESRLLVQTEILRRIEEAAKDRRL